MKPLHQVFSEAADLIEKRGLAKGVYIDGGRLCMLGAICEAATGCPVPEEVPFGPERATYEATRDILENDVLDDDAPEVNDAPDFRKRDAVAALRIAADLATPKP